ncbi:hypothetical protein CLV59_107188 [Chitinophaga dinghuensis]|uniref:Class I lanthipeptide n=1 Tax=Chitinophaga dinghuensis TaxID=1539050 RepID=A0A327VQG5_9BACT|nr:class I lanthipeptide [Chitinophaga dinghuensis]RAJ77421.1 hypothetical protein CLV59_107188 [Chitinophaga dinghuensis]
MKKKKISLEKKLTLKKEAVASLNATQQQSIAGGAIFTRLLTCDVTREASCETIPPGEYNCIVC